MFAIYERVPVVCLPSRRPNLSVSLFRKPRTILGSRMTSSLPDISCDVEYELVEDVERLERYCHGGYHPVAIGDCLHDRYIISHKLGYGSYSTTWLARDVSADMYVAIKIAVATSIDSEESIVLQKLHDLNAESKTHPGQASVMPLLNILTINGPNGKHQCFVTVPASMSLALAKEASCDRLFQPAVARAMIVQLVQAVAYVHSKGFVHAGE